MTHPLSTAMVWAFTIEVHEYLHDIAGRPSSGPKPCTYSVTSRDFRLGLEWPSSRMAGHWPCRGKKRKASADPPGPGCSSGHRGGVATALSLALLAEAYGKTGQVEEGFTVLVEARTAVERTGGHFYEAELHRLTGELLLQREKQQVTGNGQRETVTEPRAPVPDTQGEAEACFLKAIEIARRQQAKSLGLRAVTSLARLWQQQGKQTEAHNLLSEIYNWFTEGFDTKDLQEAKALLDTLS